MLYIHIHIHVPTTTKRRGDGSIYLSVNNLFKWFVYFSSKYIHTNTPHDTHEDKKCENI